MIKRILNYYNEQDREILKQSSEPVEEITEEIKTIVQDLLDTLHSISNAKGISAIQIGVPKKICVCSWSGKEVVLINPVITRTRGQEEYIEGCLSVPGFYTPVTRYQKVWCSYTDPNGEQQEIADGGRMSDIIQHEMDHFNGECKVYDNSRN